jgi:cation transport protein ChaC
MSELWIFGYGSLMWNTGFPHLEARHAILTGFSRVLCVYSVEYRGTPKRPGLVFGLDRGGSCEGVAFRVPESARQHTLSYLAERELITGIYRWVAHPVELEDGSGRIVRALCHVVDRRHVQYAGRLSLADQAAVVRASRGRRGLDLDYVLSTHRHLVELGIRDRTLERLVGLLGTSWHLSIDEGEPDQRARRTRLIALPRPARCHMGVRRPRLPAHPHMRCNHRRRLTF